MFAASANMVILTAKVQTHTAKIALKHKYTVQDEEQPYDQHAVAACADTF